MSENKGKSVKLEFEGKQWEFPVIEGTEQERAFDISKLRDQSGLVTMDNGYANTSTCQSKITFLDGEKGVLRYRGIPIEQLAEKTNFLETSFLLIYGHLPTQDELKQFSAKIEKQASLPENFTKFFGTVPRDAHPMAVLSSMVSALSTYHQDSLDPANRDQVEANIIRLIAKLPLIAAFTYRASRGLPLVQPRTDLDYCANFMHMMFSEKGRDYKVSAEISNALNLLLILHADHEQNCSTSTVRMVGSSGANLYASIAAGIGALWGPLHGGANQAVMEMLQEIHADGGNVDKYVALAKDKTSSFRLMGFGHRVYKNFDPRASIIKKACDLVLARLGTANPLLDIAKRLEAAALKDKYFIDKKLYPNVDFYSGIIYSALGIPTEMFTVMFALGRLPGWIAHWKEMNEGGTTKIGRPRQIYTGLTDQSVTPVAQRGNQKKAA